MSSQSLEDLHATLLAQIRRLIAGSILFNQKIAEDVGLRLTDMQCLNVLELLGPATPKQLAEATGLTTGGVTVMLDRMEKAGFVRRTPHPTDRRSILVTLDLKKLSSLAALYDPITRQTVAIFDQTPESELQIVARFFSRLNAIPVERGTRPTPNRRLP